MIELQELKEYLNISDTIHDPFLMKCIEFTTQKMMAYCRRDLVYGVKYDVISGNNQDIINLKVYPVDKVIYIHYRDEWTMPPGGGHNQFNKDLFNNKPVEDNIYLDENTGRVVLLKGYTLPIGTSNVEIKYLAGYSVNSPNPVCETPLDLKSVCLMSATEFFLKSFKGDGRIGLREKTEGITGLRNNEWIYKEEDYSVILNRYKEIRI